MAKLAVPKTGFEPALWVPGKQPVGPVAIDWTHPLSAGLLLFAAFTPRQQLVYPNQRISSYTGTRSTEFQLFSNSSFNPDGSVECTGSLSGVSLNASVLADRGNSISLLVGATADGFSAIQSLIGADANDAGTRDFQFRLLTDATVQFVPFSGGGAFTFGSTGTVSADVPFVAGATYTPGSQKIFIEGIVDGTNNAVGALDNDGSWAGIGVRPKDNPPSLTSDVADPLDGTIDFAAVWNRALTEAEMASMSRDPYQFLKPAF